MLLLPCVTDSLVLRQLIANLYARGAALQCAIRQESLDLLIPKYTGSIAADAGFDPAALSGVVVQIKNKNTGDKQAGISLRPIGISRDISAPLPYLALLMELGDESVYKETRSKILTMLPSQKKDVDFRTLRNNWLTAEDDFNEYERQRKTKHMKIDKEGVKKKEAAIKARMAMDSYNRYAIFVRGASPEIYGILGYAGIVNEFATLLEVTKPSPAPQLNAIQHMLPLEHLAIGSGHTAWMLKYIVGGDEDYDMECVE